MLAKRDNVVIDTILNKKKSHIFSAKPHPRTKIELKIFETQYFIFKFKRAQVGKDIFPAAKF